MRDDIERQVCRMVELEDGEMKACAEMRLWRASTTLLRSGKTMGSHNSFFPRVRWDLQALDPVSELPRPS